MILWSALFASLSQISPLVLLWTSFAVSVSIRLMSIKSSKELEEICCRVRNQRDSKVHESLQIPENDVWSDKKISSMSAVQLREAMRKGDLSCEDVVLCFIRRSRKFGLEYVNAVTDELYDEAWKMAKSLDESGIIMKTPIDDEKLPLLGLPISIKERFDQVGYATTLGIVRRAETLANRDSLSVTLIKNAGGIPFVRTNVPQLLMMSETENRIFGRTDNPWNLERSPGGSSGGETALISCRASPIGLASDVGGSIRTPSSFCGIVGFKPTPERISTKAESSIDISGTTGQRIIKVSTGPVANTVADCELLMRALTNELVNKEDPYIPPVAWNRVVAKEGLSRPLRIGLMTHDGWFQPCKAALRALDLAADVLQESGHKIIPISHPATGSGWQICKLYYGEMTTKSGGISVGEYWKLIAEHYQLREAYGSLMNEHDLDAILLPATPLPATPHGASKDLTPMLSYMMLANLLHWPAGVVPVTLVNDGEDEYYADSELPADQRCILAKKARAAMAGAKGLPVSVQLMAAPWKDELCMYAMHELESGVVKNGGCSFVPPLIRT